MTACRLEVEGTPRTLVEGQSKRPGGHTLVPERHLQHHQGDGTGHSLEDWLVQVVPWMANSVQRMKEEAELHREGLP